MAVSRADGVMTRLLFVRNGATLAEDRDAAAATRGAENALTLSLLFSGARCLLQYALLPFLLPIVGVAADATVPILLLINLVAMVSIFFSLRRFWTVGYKHRWRYLAGGGGGACPAGRFHYLRCLEVGGGLGGTYSRAEADPKIVYDSDGIRDSYGRARDASKVHARPGRD